MSYLRQMAEARELLAETYQVAWALAADMAGNDGRAQSMSGFAKDFWTSAEQLEGVLAADGLRWGDAMRSHVCGSVTPNGPDGYPRSHLAPLVARSMRVGLALARREEASLPQGLAAWAAETLGRVGMADRAARVAGAATPRPGPAVATGAEIPFLLACPVPMRARQPLQETLRVTGTCRPTVVDAADAPVAMRLRTPDGGWMPVRKMGCDFMRPVLAPGGWDAMDLHAFARAASSGEPWRDDPWAVHRSANDMALGVDERSATPPRDTPAARKLAREALAEASARAGRLHVVDGAVHRTCGEPALMLAMEGHDGDRFVTDWRIDALSSRTDQSVMRRVSSRARSWVNVGRDLPIPPLDADGQARLAARLPGLDPSAWVARDVDPDLAEADPEALLGRLCAHLAGDVTVVRDGSGPVIADAARRAAHGHDVPGDDPQLDYEGQALRALAMTFADQVSDRTLQEEAATRFVL